MCGGSNVVNNSHIIFLVKFNMLRVQMVLFMKTFKFYSPTF